MSKDRSCLGCEACELKGELKATCVDGGLSPEAAVGGCVPKGGGSAG